MTKFLPAKLHALCMFLLTFNSAFSQDFTWMTGSTLVDQPGTYGTMGVPNASNTPGGRYGAVTWTDGSGNFWLFGGQGYDFIGNYGSLSDLWKYTVATNQWTFMKGNDVISQASDYSPLGVSTPTAKPGGRHSSVAWTDVSGNLWLFGGYGNSSTSIGYLNDLWKYNPVNNEWTYVNGSTASFALANYGTLGIPSSTNTPGSRRNALGWTSPTGDLWLFGGLGASTSSVAGIGKLSDLWKYSIATNEWTWTKGTPTLDLNGTYGNLGTPAGTSNPGGRMSSTGWVDASGNFWLHGGDGWDATSTSASGLLNDLWKYNPTTNQWTWMHGTNTMSQAGLYGTQGTSGPTNMPGGRSGSVSWKDAVGTLWLFGGEGFPVSNATSGPLNDLWKFNIATNEWTWVKGSAVLNQYGIYGTQTVAYYTNNPGARSLHGAWIDSSSDLYFFGGFGNASTGPVGHLNDLWKYTNCFISPITMTITAKDSVICANETTSLTVSGSSNYLWLINNSMLSYLVITPSVSTTYTVITSDTKGCRYAAAFTETVLACTGLNTYNAEGGHQLYPNPANGEFTIVIPEQEIASTLVVCNALGQIVFSEMLQAPATHIKTDLAKGVYYYQTKTNGKTLSAGKLVIH